MGICDFYILPKQLPRDWVRISASPFRRAKHCRARQIPVRVTTTVVFFIYLKFPYSPFRRGKESFGDMGCSIPSHCFRSGTACMLPLMRKRRWSNLRSLACASTDSPRLIICIPPTAVSRVKTWELVQIQNKAERLYLNLPHVSGFHSATCCGI